MENLSLSKRSDIMALILFSWLLCLLPFLPITYADLFICDGAVIKSDFMDPCLTLDNGTWYALAGADSNPPNINFQVAASTNLTSWDLQVGYDALPIVASWAAKPPAVWAPGVNQR